MHGDRVAVRGIAASADRPARGPHRPHRRAAARRIVGRVEVDAAGRVHVVPHDRRLTRIASTVPRGEARTPAGRHGRGRDHALADGDARTRRPRRRGVRPPWTRRASTPASSSEYGIPGRAQPGGGRPKPAPRRDRGARATSRTDGLPRLADRHHRRRGRPRLRRRDLARSAAERQLLAGRAHRRRRALRARRAAPSTRRRTIAARRSTSPSGPSTCSRRNWRPASAASSPDVDRLVQSCLMEVDARGERRAATSCTTA